MRSFNQQLLLICEVMKCVPEKMVSDEYKTEFYTRFKKRENQIYEVKGVNAMVQRCDEAQSGEYLQVVS